MIRMTNESLPSDASEIRAAVFRLSRRMRQQRAVAEMTDGQFAVLAHLNSLGPHTLSALADREGITAPSMNRTVNGLEELGFLTRTEDPDDRRRVSIAITDAGREVVTETTRRRDEWLARVLAGLNADDRAALRRAAEVILREVERDPRLTAEQKEAQK
ncbi:MarR family transcriptional regulator [Microbacterium sediminis]|uniref:MarR family transcriptional regulator n=2 Tax=Microbacterium sediminis TaxID=904291 RepID=A0A1B9NDV9_9MICO|nr:MarR family transcriptional regulator [Microbacterium sediminis]QBR75094.1 MarR family transcriptional regulator [Microbacterium sediminis]